MQYGWKTEACMRGAENMEKNGDAGTKLQKQNVLTISSLRQVFDCSKILLPISCHSWGSNGGLLVGSYYRRSVKN
jgi:hypothetical protein